MKKFFEGKKMTAVILLGLAYVFWIAYGIATKVNNVTTYSTFWVTLVIWTILFGCVIVGMLVPFLKKLGKVASFGLFGYALIEGTLSYPPYFGFANGSDKLYNATAILFGVAGILLILALLSFAAGFAIPLVGWLFVLIGEFLSLGACVFLFVGGFLAFFEKDYQGKSEWYYGLSDLARAFMLAGGLFAFPWALDTVTL